MKNRSDKTLNANNSRLDTEENVNEDKTLFHPKWNKKNGKKWTNTWILNKQTKWRWLRIFRLKL